VPESFRERGERNSASDNQHGTVAQVHDLARDISDHVAAPRIARRPRTSNNKIVIVFFDFGENLIYNDSSAYTHSHGDSTAFNDLLLASEVPGERGIRVQQRVDVLLASENRSVHGCRLGCNRQQSHVRRQILRKVAGKIHRVRNVGASAGANKNSSQSRSGYRDDENGRSDRFRYRKRPRRREEKAFSAFAFGADYDKIVRGLMGAPDNFFDWIAKLCCDQQIEIWPVKNLSLPGESLEQFTLLLPGFADTEDCDFGFSGFGDDCRECQCSASPLRPIAAHKYLHWQVIKDGGLREVSEL
jgi:hypothetical protein